MEALLAAQSALHWLAVFGSAAADCASANSPTNVAHTAAVKVGFITRLRENLPERFGGSVGEKGTAALATATDPQPLTGSRARSLFVLPLSRQIVNAAPKTIAAPCGAAVVFGSGRLCQCAVKVEESASTAGSVLTEVSVGLAFSSSHSIASGLRTSARAKTSSMRETGTISRPFLMLSLIST